MRHLRFSVPCIAAVMAVLATSLLLAPCFAQAIGAPAEAPPLPTDPERWMNSSPLSYEGLRGKGVVLWYFEETCPKCAGKWEGLKQLAEENADKPVLFVAVNSGTDPRQLAAYLAKHDIDWPVIVDPDRSFERASGVNEISLQNIHQVKALKSDGSFTWGRWDKLAETVDAVADGADWKVKYDRLHPALHAAVRRMEFGDYRPVAVAIAHGLKDRDPKVKRAARQVSEHIEKQMRQALEQAIDGAAADDAWAQFEARERVAQKFAPHKLPKDEATKLEKLRRDPAVKQELTAARAVEANAAALQSEDERERKRAAGRLERVLKTFPKTRAAARAKELLAGADAPA